MAVMTERSGGKYPRNGRNGFDCPVPNCERKGLKGFTTGQGVGVHMRTEHPGWWVGPTGEVHGPSEPSAPAAQANGNGNGAHDLAPAEPDPADDFERQTGFTDPRRSLPPARAATAQNLATEAVVAILAIPQVRLLTPAQARGVFDAVTTIRRLDDNDDGNPATESPPDAPR